MKNKVIFSAITLFAITALAMLTVQTEPALACPTVCREMWEVSGGTCVFDECGSGCGPNGLTTFATQRQCNTALQGLCYGSVGTGK